MNRSPPGATPDFRLSVQELVMARWFLVACGVLSLQLLVGCTSSPPPVAISGTVTVDGKPLPEGDIILTGEGTAPETFQIKDGKFEGQAKIGKKRVEIHAMKKGEPTKMGDKVIEASPVNYLPARYNTESKITAEVTASGLNPNKFETKSE
jgi:hypothetical protein